MYNVQPVPLCKILKKARHEAKEERAERYKWTFCVGLAELMEGLCEGLGRFEMYGFLG